MQILSSSLLALAALLDVLVGSSSSLWKEGSAESTSAASAPVGAGEAVKVATTSLFHKHKSFESSVKSKSSQVRSAAYQTLRTYIQHIPEVYPFVITYMLLCVAYLFSYCKMKLFIFPDSMTPYLCTVLNAGLF